MENSGVYPNTKTSKFDYVSKNVFYNLMLVVLRIKTELAGIKGTFTTRK